ncbi:hypothetical protein Ahy_A05g021957 isoform C [Arachis hypogaea]|uniref:Uncharacterized protein n=1 Tax=Arachis hypogaea TaxID=3818 RepID=A0A445CZ35_ARAHY|nr:hypothetical protein Ahy_A05g021957 isoform C [Arachis hypogaea]
MEIQETGLHRFHPFSDPLKFPELSQELPRMETVSCTTSLIMLLPDETNLLHGSPSQDSVPLQATDLASSPVASKEVIGFMLPPALSPRFPPSFISSNHAGICCSSGPCGTPSSLFSEALSVGGGDLAD